MWNISSTQSSCGKPSPACTFSWQWRKCCVNGLHLADSWHSSRSCGWMSSGSSSSASASSTFCFSPSCWGSCFASGASAWATPMNDEKNDERDICVKLHDVERQAGNTARSSPVVGMSLAIEAPTRLLPRCPRGFSIRKVLKRIKNPIGAGLSMIQLRVQV